MKSASPSYKHDSPTYAKFSQSGDSSLLRKGFANGGDVDASIPTDPVTGAPLASSRASAPQKGVSITQEESVNPPSPSHFAPKGMRPGNVAKTAAAYPGYPQLSVDAAWENRAPKKSSYERTNPSWGTAI